MAACSSGSVISGRSIRLSIGRPLRVLPNGFVVGLDLLLDRMRGHVDAEPAQARERGGYSLLVFGLHDLELDPQTIDGGLVNFRCGAQQ